MKYINLLVITLFLFACSEQTQKANFGSVVHVQMAKVEKQSLAPVVKGSGFLESAAERKLAFKTGGVIKEITVQEGAEVKAGQLLARLDLAEINALNKQAQSGLSKAQRDYQRISKLYDDSVATLEQLQNVETALQVARANARIAAFNFKHSTIVAPENGLVLKRFAEEGELISPGMPVFYFGGTENSWRLKCAVSAVDILNLSSEDKAEITFDAYPNKILEASVSQLGRAASPMTGLFEVELVLQDTDIKLLSGLFGKAEIQSSKKQDYFVVPAEAMSEAQGDKAILFTVQDSVARRITATISEIKNNQLVITDGLKNVPQVVTKGAAYLKEGARVKVEEN